MGVFDKMLSAMKLGDEDYDDDEYDDEYDDDEEVEERKSIFKHSDESEKKSSSGASISRFTTMRGGKKNASNSMEVCVIKPSSFEDAREIAETLLADRTVILNMEGLDLALAQRLIDFISGACYAIDGNLQKVSNYIFIITPANVDISGDLQELMSAFDFSGIQTGF